MSKIKNTNEKLRINPIEIILMLQLITNAICITVFYRLFPYLLNYPPGSINTPFQLMVNPTYYWVYYFSIFALGSIIQLIITYKLLKPLKKLNKRNLSIEDKLAIRKVAYTFPNKALILTMVVIPIAAIFFLLLITNTNLILTIKIGLLAVIFLGIPSILMNIVENRLLKEILIKTFDDETFKTEKIKNSKLSRNLMLQIFPIFIVSIVILVMFGIANMTEQLGNYRFDAYKQKLNTVNQSIQNEKITTSNLTNYLNEILEGEEWFVKINDIYYTSKDTEISEFMKKYMNYYGKDNGGRIYDDFGVDYQGAIAYIEVYGQEVVVGILYNTVPNYLFANILVLALFFAVISFLITYLATSSVQNDLKHISNRLAKISKNKTIENNFVPITSTDERGRLTREFNNVQDNTVELYKKIQKNQEIIALQAKFAGIGELASGMAHDINNPASSIEMSVKLLEDIETKEEYEEDYKELVNNIKVSVNKILNVVNNVSAQFKNHSNETKERFSLKSLLEEIERTEETYIVASRCKLDIIMQKEIYLYGTRSKMYQILVNIVRNAVQAYKEKNIENGEINVYAFEDGNNYVISIEDFAGGLPEEIKQNLFKNILTTRGTRGTGLGLYLAGENIREAFNGEITFESELNKGTTFYLKIPKIKEEE